MRVMKGKITIYQVSSSINFLISVLSKLFKPQIDRKTNSKLEIAFFGLQQASFNPFYLLHEIVPWDLFLTPSFSHFALCPLRFTFLNNGNYHNAIGHVRSLKSTQACLHYA